MKKMMKRLVAGVIMTTIISTPVFAKEGDKYYNDKLGCWFVEVHKNGIVYLENQTTGDLVEKGSMRSIPSYKLGKEAGPRTIKAVVKNGVTMVPIVDLAKAMDLKLEDFNSFYSLSACDNEGNDVVSVWIHKPNSNAVKSGIHYSTEMRINHESGYKVNPSTEIKFAPKNAKFTIKEIHDPSVYPQFSYHEGFIPFTDVEVKGKFSLGKAEYINKVLYVPAKDVIRLINEEVTDIIYNKANKTVTFEKENQYYNMTLSYVTY